MKYNWVKSLRQIELSHFTDCCMFKQTLILYFWRLATEAIVCKNLIWSSLHLISDFTVFHSTDDTSINFSKYVYNKP